LFLSTNRLVENLFKHSDNKLTQKHNKRKLRLNTPRSKSQVQGSLPPAPQGLIAVTFFKIQLIKALRHLSSHPVSVALLKTAESPKGLSHEQRLKAGKRSAD